MIQFTDHAERKIKQRNLKKAWIRKVVENPEYVVKSYGNRRVAYRKIGKLYLATVFVKEKNNLVVLTAHWDKAFKPDKIKREEGNRK